MSSHPTTQQEVVQVKINQQQVSPCKITKTLSELDHYIVCNVLKTKLIFM